MLLEQDPSQYFYINQGCLTVDNMDDKEEMKTVEVTTEPIVDARELFGDTSESYKDECLTEYSDHSY